ncbi:hypothetical protein D3C75_1220160 [compost metagenome]
MLCQQGSYLSDHADLVEDMIGDDQRLAMAIALDIGCRFLQAARSHQVDRGNVEFECRHGGLR